MYRYDSETNRIIPIKTSTFADLGLRERQNLQEWLAAHPEALGDLLIIQKEFSGFDGTQERLDLLALDRDGNLVVIENKLDDSGRDVAWQALKYTAYVSGMTSDDIVRTFQSYLGDTVDAKQKLKEFFDCSSLDDISLNHGNNQRIILVAANFRQEVTATVLWLNSRQIDVRCFRVTPYEHNQEVLIDIEQIIPIPETAEYMVRVSAKEAEEKVREARYKIIAYEYWTELLKVFKDSGLHRFDNVGPKQTLWLDAHFNVRGCALSLNHGKSEIRVQLKLGRSKPENKWLFNQLYERKDQFEAVFGDRLDWDMLPEAIVSRVSYAKAADGYNKEEWPEMIAWMAENIRKFDDTFTEEVKKLVSEMPRDL